MERVKQLIFDLIPVAVGVFLALWLSGLAQSRNLSVEKKQSLQAIASEVHQNTSLLIRRMPYHKRMYDSLNAQINRNADEIEGQYVLSANFIPTYQGGFNNGLGTYPGLNSNAWTSVIEGNIVSLIDFDLRMQLSESYSNLAGLRVTKESTLRDMSIFNGNCLDGASKPSDILNFSSNLTDLLIQQRRQIRLNLNLLEDLSGFLPDETPALPDEKELKELLDLSSQGI